MAVKVKGARDKYHVVYAIGGLEASSKCNSIGGRNPPIGVALTQLSRRG